MQVNGPAHVHGPQNVQGPSAARTARPEAPPTPAHQGDQVELSDAARMAAQLADVPDVRQDRVADVKARIAEGTYETGEKLDLAVERLLDEIA